MKLLSNMFDDNKYSCLVGESEDDEITEEATSEIRDSMIKIIIFNVRKGKSKLS